MVYRDGEVVCLFVCPVVATLLGPNIHVPSYSVCVFPVVCYE